MLGRGSSVRSLVGRTVTLLAATVALVLVPAGPASAAVTLSMDSTSAGSFTVGDTGVPATVHVTNNSTGAQAAGTVTLSEISLWPTCGTQMLTSCTNARHRRDRHERHRRGHGRQRLRRPDVHHRRARRDGKVSFTPANQVVLALGAKCEIAYTFSVLKMPTKDSNPGPGVQSTEIGIRQGHPHGHRRHRDVHLLPHPVRLQGHPHHLDPGLGVGAPGRTIFATATLSGGTSPTGTITFDLFPPADTTCLGAPAFETTKTVTGNGPYQSAGFVANTPGTWRWTSQYNGDVNNSATPRTPCAAAGAAVVVTATGPSLGELRVTTNPAVRSQILVDGVIRDSFGLNWLDLPPGSYTVSFTHVEGFTEPAPQTVNVVAGATTTVQGNFVAEGFPAGHHQPRRAGTIRVDGIPRNDSGMWTDLPVGAHEVCFGPVAGFNPPACQTANLTAGNLTTITGNYSTNAAAPGPTNVGELRVTTSPALPSQILVDGTPRDTFGLGWLDLAPGSYTVSFTHVEGFTEPAPQTVNVVAGATTTVQGNFVATGHAAGRHQPGRPRHHQRRQRPPG